MENKTQNHQLPEGREAQTQRLIWQRATLDDLKDFDFEQPIANSKAADVEDLGDLFRKTIERPKGADLPADTPANRVFLMLSAIAGMHFKPDDHNEPFGPMAVWTDGRRSAIPEDFRIVIDVVAYLAERAKNPVLRARLSDLCWLLDRKRWQLGTVAISAYVEIIQKVDAGGFAFPFEKEGGALQYQARDYLRRALQIGRAIGWDRTETIAARDWVAQLRERAIDLQALVQVHWFSELDLDFGISDPLAIAKTTEALLSVGVPEKSSRFALELWRLAARAYHDAKDSESENRCRAQAAECLVAEAEQAFMKQGSAMLASHCLSAAIAEFHGIPAKKERRTELRHRLIDIQAQVPDELTTFSQKIDLREIVEQVERGIQRPCLLDMFFAFAALEHSPEPKQLVQAAVKSIHAHPLASLFGASHHDSEGKVIHRTEGGGVGDGSNEGAVQQQIAQTESIRRKIAAFGGIDVARRAINKRHYLSDDVLKSLLRWSPFVPEDLLGTFSRGFLRFFQGDFVSAVYILTPLLENSLRHVLKLHGHDVTTFDSNTQTQADRSISSLFDGMRKELDDIFTEEITTDIENVFLIKPGPYLRHQVAHGLLHDGDPYGADAIYACWLIFSLCLLPLFAHRHEISLASDGTAAKALAAEEPKGEA
ncbi:MAG: DUF7380 domain-containing protein [Methyloceanibacter sp.]